VAARRFPLIPVVLCTAVALASAIGVYAAFGPDEDQADVTDATLPMQATGELPSSVQEVRLTGMGGADDRTLGDFTGEKPVVLNFFASWCAPCLREMPAFEAVHEELGDRVNFVGLANLDTEDKALEMVAETGVTYPTFADVDASAITYFGGTQMPTTVFIDASGEVVSVESQAFDEDELRARVDDLFGVPSPS
jgi:thiol-disulfide isomerase/thioredoxin